MSNPTTYLALCQRTARECGVAGTGPATVTGQAGEHARIVAWVDTAYSNIQNLHEDWDFLWGEDTLTLVDGQDTYTDLFTSNNVRALDGPAYIYDATVGVSDKSRLTELDYRVFRPRYLNGTRQSGKPVRFTQKPNESAIVFDLVPDSDTYRVDYTYWRDNHSLTNNTDITLLPAKHTLTIVWRAVMMYAQYEEAINLYQSAKMDYERCLQDLRNSHLPKRVIKMRPLA